MSFIENLKSFISPIKVFLSVFKQKKDSFYYNIASIKNRYPCKMVGGKHIFDAQDTTIIYTILNKKERFEISIKELLDDMMLLEKFHPSQAVKLGCIAFGDLLMKIPENQRVEKYQEITKKMFLDAENNQ